MRKDIRSVVLYNLREKGEMAFDDLMYITIETKRIHNRTGDEDFFNLVINWFNDKIINISDKEVVDYITRCKGKGSYRWSTYGFTEFLQNKDLHRIKINLTDYFYHIQNTLGFSITDLYEKEKHSQSIYIDPIWGKPNEKMTCDVFVIMPFSDELNPVYEDHIAKVIKNSGLDLARADLVLNTGSVVKDVWSLIYNAKVIICDCTNRNPNVFYELGIAHSLGKKTICITQSEADIPFDIKHLRYIKYEYTPRGMIEFEKSLEKHIAIIGVEKLSSNNHDYFF